MKLSIAGAVILALLLVGAGWFARGYTAGRDRQALRDSAAQSREASRVSDSLRLADRLAHDSARAESAAQLVALQQRARSLGAAASSLVDTLVLQAPDTCLPGLRRIQFAWRIHLEADRVADSAGVADRARWAQSLTAERAHGDLLALQRDTAQVRLERALAMPGKRSGFLPGVVVGVVIVGGVVLLAR